MSKSAKKKPVVILSASRDIAFDKLILSQANVRRTKVGVSIEELADDIARRGLLQGLSARAVVDESGAETGLYEVPAGQSDEAVLPAAAAAITEPLEPEDDDGLAPISDKLLTELTAHRTLGLRHALGARPDVAFLAALHALVLKAFYHHATDTCLELDLRSNTFGTAGSGLQDSAAAEVIRSRHDGWSKTLPDDAADLWDALGEWDADSRSDLFAHVVSLSINAVHENWNRRSGVLAHADRLSEAVELDMTKLWTPTTARYLGRITKGRILQAVAEARGERAADRIAHLKKTDMAAEAEALLAGANWLPEVLRPVGGNAAGAMIESVAEEQIATDGVDDADEPHEDEAAVHPIAAE